MITLEQLPPGHPGRAYFTGDTIWLAVQSDPRVSYGLHVPEGFTPGGRHPVVVAVHGTSRRAQELRAAWSPWSERRGAVIVAPLFPAGLTGPDDLDSYKAIESHGVRFDQVLFDLLGEVNARWGVDVSRFYLVGHSGGGQFVLRMLLLHPHRLAGAAISAPGRITLVDPEQPWPRGTADTRQRFGIDVDAAAVAAVPVLLTAGEGDADPSVLIAQRDASQEGYGATRVERLATLAANLRENGANVTVELAPGAGHQGDPTLEIQQRFLDELISAGSA